MRQIRGASEFEPVIPKLPRHVHCTTPCYLFTFALGWHDLLECAAINKYPPAYYFCLLAIFQGTAVHKIKTEQPIK